MPLFSKRVQERVYNLSERFICLLQKIISTILKHKIFFCIFGQNEENYGITSGESLTVDRRHVLDEPQFGPSLSSFIPTSPPTSTIDDHLESPQSYKKKALLVGVESTNEPGSTERVLRGPHKDIRDMRQFLIDRYHYDPDNITLLINTNDPAQVQPTKKNIEQNCKELVAGACKGDRLFFHFAGHTTQKPTDGEEEEDGKDEYILTCDGEEIQDNSLREMLVDTLPAGATLVAVFDACNSGTLLDLEHHRCNRVYVPWINKGVRRTKSRWNIVARRNALASALSSVLLSPTTLPVQLVGEIFPIVPPRRSATIAAGSGPDGSGMWNNWSEFPMRCCDSPVAPLCDSPVARFCTGHCNQNVPEPQPSDKTHVICLSSAKDCQRSWQDPQGSSMTQALIKILTHKPDATISDVLAAVSHELHAFYLDLHDNSRQYKRQMRDTNKRRRVKGRQSFRRQTVEMDNFQDPQISSHGPLDMKKRWEM